MLSNQNTNDMISITPTTSQSPSLPPPVSPSVSPPSHSSDSSDSSPSLSVSSEEISSSRPSWLVRVQDQLVFQIISFSLSTSSSSSSSSSRKSSSLSSPSSSNSASRIRGIFRIQLSLASSQWIVERSFGDFLYLHNELCKCLLKDQLPVLPSFIPSQDEKMTMDQFQHYLSQIITLPQSWFKYSLIQFLDNEKKLLLCLWSAERVQSMQEALVEYAAKNGLNADSLNDELEIAREQIQGLRSEILTLEILLLSMAPKIEDITLSSEALTLLKLNGDSPQIMETSRYAVKTIISKIKSKYNLPDHENVEKKNHSSSHDNSTTADSTDNSNLYNDQIFQEILQSLTETSEEIPEITLPLWVTTLHEICNNFILKLIPSQEMINSHQFVYQTLRRVLFKNSMSQIFIYGNEFQLFDEPTLQMTAVLPPEYLSNWYIKANEALCVCAMTKTPSSASPSEDRSLNQLIVRNVGFRESNLEIIKATINNLELELSANQILRLYHRSLLELINAYIGKSNLFKRSLILIEAWWKKEAIRIASSQLPNQELKFLSTIQLAVMTLSIFFKFGEKIREPFEVLILFFDYFAKFDWEKHAITLYGPVDVEDLSPLTELTNISPLETNNIPVEIIESHRARFRQLEEGWNEKVGSEQFDKLASDAHVNQPSQFLKKLFEKNTYRRGPLNIIDPIQFESNSAVDLDDKSASMILSIIQKGRNSLIQACCNSKSHQPATRIYFSQFFQNTFDQLTEVNNSPFQSTTFPSVDEYQRLFSNQSLLELERCLKYIELIIGSMISLESLAETIAAIIEARGPIPVGEIGKLLLEVTGNENLSSVLKTKYRGLKKVIESFPHILVLGNEHPFNPLVHISDKYPLKSKNLTLEQSHPPSPVPVLNLSTLSESGKSDAGMNSSRSDESLQNPESSKFKQVKVRPEKIQLSAPPSPTPPRPIPNYPQSQGMSPIQYQSPYIHPLHYSPYNQQYNQHIHIQFHSQNENERSGPPTPRNGMENYPMVYPGSPGSVMPIPYGGYYGNHHDGPQQFGGYPYPHPLLRQQQQQQQPLPPQANLSRDNQYPPASHPLPPSTSSSQGRPPRRGS